MLRPIVLSVILAVVCVGVSHADTELGLHSDDFALRQSENSEIHQRSLAQQYGPRLSEHGDSQSTMVWYGNGLLWPSALEAGDTRIAQTDTTKTEKKKRQKKRPTVTTDQQADTDTSTDTDTYTESDDDGGFLDGSLDACGETCVESFFDLLCAAFSSDTDQDTITTNSIDDGSQTGTGTMGETVASIPAEVLIALPYSAILKPQTRSASTLTLWDAPGGTAASAYPMAYLASGSRVSVVERQTISKKEWVRVQCAGVPEPGGWIRESDVSVSSEPPVDDEPSTPDKN